jgi:hypothetical protein
LATMMKIGVMMWWVKISVSMTMKEGRTKLPRAMRISVWVWRKEVSMQLKMSMRCTICPRKAQ